MAHQNIDLVLDSSTTLQTDPTTYAATGNNSVIVDLGPGYRDLDIVFNWTACAVAAGDAITFRIQGSNVADMGSAVHVLGTLILGVVAVTGNAVNTPANGQTLLRCHNLVFPSASDSASQQPVRYVRLSWVRAAAGSVTMARCGISYQAS